jgi:hypothetical protein
VISSTCHCYTVASVWRRARLAGAHIAQRVPFSSTRNSHGGLTSWSSQATSGQDRDRLGQRTLPNSVTLGAEPRQILSTTACTSWRPINVRRTCIEEHGRPRSYNSTLARWMNSRFVSHVTRSCRNLLTALRRPLGAVLSTTRAISKQQLGTATNKCWYLMLCVCHPSWETTTHVEYPCPSSMKHPLNCCNQPLLQISCTHDFVHMVGYRVVE